VKLSIKARLEVWAAMLFVAVSLIIVSIEHTESIDQ